jgi:bifunctional UDP-N-acetylglucosamine pyrophosphorylase / glucosamine-1-phosphate N-acetyltransferase
MTQQGFSLVLLAAGKATRFKSEYSKLLHRLAGRPLGEYVLRATLSAGPEQAYMIVGHGADEVRKCFARPGLTFVEQKEQLGTGHALMVARAELERCHSPTVVVMVGDAPLLRAETIRDLVEAHTRAEPAATVLTTFVDNPTGYGRILRAQAGGLIAGAPESPADVKAGGRNSEEAGNVAPVSAIIEERVCTPSQRAIREISAGILCFSRRKLLDRLGELTTDNAQKEYLLTDLVEIFNRHGERVLAFPVANWVEVLGVNDRVDLARLGRLLRLRKAESLMREGVTILDPETTYIDEDVQVGRDSIIEPGVSLLGSTRVGSACMIQPYSSIADSVVGDRAVIRQGSLVSNSNIVGGASVGPFAHVRDGSLIDQGARIGNFVEVKKSRVGRDAKALHLTYLGDALVERNVNIGAGTVTCNYDGQRKYPTTIEEGSFIGSGTMLVAPVRVGKRAYVAAGSTVTEDVPPESLAVGRARQVNKEGWGRGKRGKGKPEDQRPEAHPSSPIKAASAPDSPTVGILPKQAKMVAEALSRVTIKDAKPAPAAEPAAGEDTLQPPPLPPPPSASVSVREIGTVTVFDVDGKLTRGEAASALRQKVHDALESGRYYILINMAKVSFLDSAGIGELMAAAIELGKVQGQLKLSGLSARVMRSISASNLNRVLDIHPDEADALASFRWAS